MLQYFLMGDKDRMFSFNNRCLLGVTILLSEHRYLRSRMKSSLKRLKKMRIKEVMNVKTFSVLISSITNAFIFAKSY